MQTLSSMSPSVYRPNPLRDRTLQPVSPLVAILCAVATLAVVAALSTWAATSHSSSTPTTRIVQSTTAAELNLVPTGTGVRSVTAAEQPRTITPGIIQSVNAAEQPVAVPTAVGHTAHVPPKAVVANPPTAGHFQ